MKKLAFVACLLVPAALFLYGKLQPYYAEYKAAKQVTAVVRQIPLDDFKQFPKAPSMPQMPTLVPTHVTKVVPVRPKAHVKPLVTHAAPKAHITLPKVRPVLPPPPPVVLAPQEPEEQQPIEYCALWFISLHCGRAPE